VPWRLLGIAMPVCIALVALIGGAAGLGAAAALLLAAALAPTDPVLASEVQVGEPSREAAAIHDEAEDEVRFALTAEAGFNDGLAFPFVYAAVFLVGGAVGGWWLEWLAWELIGKVAVGVAMGLATGWVLARLAFSGHQLGLRFADTAEAMLALAAIGISYGAAEVVGGYGFLAVFVTALVIRAYERTHEYHGVLHAFVHQVERLLTLAVLFVLGYACVNGLLGPLTWQLALIGVVLVGVVRPVVGWWSLTGAGLPSAERAAIAAFGVRGVGTFYYLAYAAGAVNIADADLEQVWAAAAFTVLLSIVVHGMAAGPAMAWLDRRREQDTVPQR
jgi:NhaP-type Na+/H+ or K+/H+ antiporter